VASEAKWNIAFLAAGLVAGFLVTDARRLLRSRYLLLGCVIAAALAAPDVIWQAAHGWPSLDVFRALQTAAGQNRATYWPAQIFFTGVALTPIWVAGLIWSLRSEAARRFRPVAIACAIVIVAQFVLGGKAYYPGGAYTFLFAAGVVPLERRLAVYSGANNFWLWGPPPAADSAAIVVNLDPAFLRREFAHVRLVATFRNGLGVSDDEEGTQVYLATGLKSSWVQAWPAFRDYS
jgi:hypothetical protein